MINLIYFNEITRGRVVASDNGVLSFENKNCDYNAVKLTQRPNIARTFIWNDVTN